MKNTNHPWKLLEPDQVRGPEGQFVADCHCGFKREADRVNARLIAAAPELLNALQLAEATINRLHRHAPGSANGTLDVIKAAISKAEGNA